MRFLRIILLIIDVSSLLLIPYAFLAWACYMGLCGGSAASEIGKKYATFYGYFGGVYFIILMMSLYVSRRFNKIQELKKSIYCLLIPLFCLLPLVYVEIQSAIIQNKYYQEEKKYHTANPADYVCSPGQFVRLGRRQGEYYFFEIINTAVTVSAYQSYDELQTQLKGKSINLEDCKNQAGDTLVKDG